MRSFQNQYLVKLFKWDINDFFRCVLDKDSNLLFLMVEGGTVTQNIRPFEPEPETMKIREKSHAKLTTEVSHTMYMKTRTSDAQNIFARCIRETTPFSFIRGFFLCAGC